MATREVPSHPVEAEEQQQSKGFLGKVKASGGRPAEAGLQRRRAVAPAADRCAAGGRLPEGSLCGHASLVCSRISAAPECCACSFLPSDNSSAACINPRYRCRSQPLPAHAASAAPSRHQHAICIPNANCLPFGHALLAGHAVRVQRAHRGDPCIRERAGERQGVGASGLRAEGLPLSSSASAADGTQCVLRALLCKTVQVVS